MDAVSQAARNVSILLNRKLDAPPIPIKSIRKQEDTNVDNPESPYGNITEPVNIVKISEVWKVYLEKNEENLDFVYIIVTADYTLKGYRNGEWSNIQYCGFYTTVEEAQNEISGYLK